jgi:hypothetical protein
MVGTKLLFYEETQRVCSAKTKFSRLGRVGDSGETGLQASTFTLKTNHLQPSTNFCLAFPTLEITDQNVQSP